MSTLQIHITAGPQAGARLQLNQSPVTFGRSGDCTLILDLPVVSRLHGELQLDEQGQWLLVNHSPNGTRVGRKKATKKPIALTDGVSITIGDTEVFRVHLTAEAADADTAREYDTDEQAQQPEQRAPGAGMKGRSKLWIGLGAWFAVCLLAIIFFATLGGGDDGPKNNTSAGFYYPGREIDDMVGDEAGILAIRRLLSEPPAYQDPNASRFDSNLDLANQAAEQGSASLYEAYRHYQLAISFSENRDEPFDMLRYNRILDELSEIIYARYIYAYRSYHESNFQSARDTLDRLRMEYYNNPDADDALANHIRKLRNAAHQRAN